MKSELNKKSLINPKSTYLKFIQHIKKNRNNHLSVYRSSTALLSRSAAVLKHQSDIPGRDSTAPEGPDERRSKALTRRGGRVALLAGRVWGRLSGTIACADGIAR